jgi:hypothetical protein
MKKTCLNFFVIFMLVPELNASVSGLFFEPALTYEVGETKLNYPTPFNSSAEDILGLGLGARLGFHIKNALFFALDLRYSMPEFSDSATNYKTESTSSSWGPVIGLQVPSGGFRVWGTYLADGELNPKESNGIDMKFSEANGFRVGTGIRLANLSLNLEYQELKYNKAELERSTIFPTIIDFNNTSLESKLWIVSLSFPFGL